METTAALKWETTRKLGKTKYITLYWAIRFGLGLAVLLTLIELLTEKRINTTWVIIRCLVFPIIGSLAGNVKWSSQENKYELHKQSISN